LEIEDLQNRTANEIILGYTALAHRLARPFHSLFINNFQDLQSAALLGLCEGVCAAIRQEKREFIPQFIYLYVRQNILEELANCSLIPLPRSFIRKKRKEALDQNISFSYKELSAVILSTAGQDFTYDIGKEDFRWFEMFDLFKFLELSDFEIQVILLRIFEFRMHEIAKELECSTNWISLTLKKISGKRKSSK